MHFLHQPSAMYAAASDKVHNAAQARLCQGSVLIIGAGGLGSPAALYLSAAGVGRLGIVDTDAVELSNLHRQIAHQEASVGQHKAASAAASCTALNSSIQAGLSSRLSSPINAWLASSRHCLRAG